MTRLKTTILASTLAAGLGGVALAQMPTYDPEQLPAMQGKVTQYTLTPRGDVDGLILADGTEVHVPPNLSTQLVFSVKPGDSVTIHGLKARALPMVMAMSVTNDATHATVTATGRTMFRREGSSMEAQGKIKEQLHGPGGELNGVLLEDGTIVRLPPPEAERLASQLGVGQALYVKGDGVANALGHVIGARSIGASKDQVTEIRGPRPGWSHWMDAIRHGPDGGPGGEHRGGPGGPGPDGNAPPPPTPTR